MTPNALCRPSDPAPAAEEAGLQVTDLAAGYPTPGGHRQVFAAIGFTLAPGEGLALVGPSGCGKSTLLHALAGVLTPDTGAVRVAGKVVAAPGRAGPCEHTAYMFQDDLLLPWKSVLDNAVLPALLARPRGERRRARPGLEERARQLLGEFGVGERLDAVPAELSGGMRQRVALARTLLLGRSLILLDEPFGSLDALTRADLQRWLVGVRHNHPATWVLVTHDVTEAVLLADRVAVLGGSPAGIVGWVVPPANATGAHRGLEHSVRQVQRLLERGREP